MGYGTRGFACTSFNDDNYEQSSPFKYSTNGGYNSILVCRALQVHRKGEIFRIYYVPTL